MADHTHTTDLPMPAAHSSRTLLSALTSWWSPGDAAQPDPMLGYESAQPWMLDDTPGAGARPLHYY